jgi:nitrogen-specific signal transduction histidine kinase
VEPDTPKTRPSRDATALAEWLDENGNAEAAGRVRELADKMIVWEAEVTRKAGEALSVHHDIRNALTGVLGNAQLVLMGPGAEVPGVRRRLEVLIHEAERIKEISDRLHRARAELIAEDGRVGERAA